MTAVDLAVGLCSVAFRRLNCNEVIDAAVAAGVTHLEWGGDKHVPIGDVDTAREVGEATTAAGLAVASYGSYLHAGRLADGPRRLVDDTLDIALALGAPNVRVWASGDAAVADLSTICAAARHRDLQISTEFHPGTATETAAGTVALLDAVNAPNLQTYWQPDPTLDVDAQKRELGAVLPMLSHLHVFAWRPDRSRLALADGATLWPGALAATALAAPVPNDNRRVAFLEFVRDDSPAQLVADAAVLRSWIAGDSP